MSSHHESVSHSFPPGYEDEYVGWVLRDVAISFTVLEVVFVGLRYFAQRLARKPWGLDDLLMIPALILCLALNASALIGLQLGRIGYHIDVVKARHPEALIPWAKVLVITPIIYSAACCLPKVVLLLLYLRIFTEKLYRHSCYVLIGIVVAVAVADIVTGAVICTPVAFLWDKTIPGGRCIDIPVYYRYGTLPNAITDLLMLILPLPVVWKLHTTKRVKVGLTLTFLTGSVGMVTSILRCVAFFTNDPLKDGTWISVTFVNWSIIEPGTYLIAACLPCYRPIVNYFISGDTQGSRTKGPSFNTAVSNSSHGRKPGPGFAPLGLGKNELEMEGVHIQSRYQVQRQSDEENLMGKHGLASHVTTISAQPPGR